MREAIHRVWSDTMRSARIPARVYILAGCLAAIGCNAFMLGAIAPAISKSFGVAGAEVMVAATFYGLGTALSALFLPRYIDRFGPFRCLKFAMAVFALAVFLSALVRSSATLAMTQVFAGGAVGVAVPAIYAGALAIAPRGMESRSVGIALGGWTLSLIAGVGLSTVLAGFVNWRAAYVAVALLSALNVLLLMRIADRRRRASASSKPPLMALGIRELRPMLATCVAAMAAFYGLYSYLGDFLHHGLGQPLIVNGLATFLYGLGFGAATAFDGIVDRLGAARLAPAVFLLGSILYIAVALSALHLAGVLIAFGLLGLVNHLQVNTLVTRMTGTEPGSKGAILGLNTAVTYVGSMIGTATFGPVYTAYGFRAAAGVSAGLMLIATFFATRPAR